MTKADAVELLKSRGFEVTHCPEWFGYMVKNPMGGPEVKLDDIGLQEAADALPEDIALSDDEFDSFAKAVGISHD